MIYKYILYLRMMYQFFSSIFGNLLVYTLCNEFIFDDHIIITKNNHECLLKCILYEIYFFPTAGNNNRYINNMVSC